jgi:hypothetical protein
MTDIRGYFKHISRGKNVSNSQILRRPQDDKDGVVDMALAFVGARQNSRPLQLLNNSPPLTNCHPEAYSKWWSSYV